MAFDDLTPNQIQPLIQLIEALNSGNYRDEFVYFRQAGEPHGFIHLYGNPGMTDHKIAGFTDTNIETLKQEGYLTTSARMTALKAKANQQYRLRIQGEAQHQSPIPDKPLPLDKSDIESPTRTTYSLFKIPLTEPETLWLREVYESFKNNEEVDIKALKVKLRGQIPTDFEPKKIDDSLLRLGRLITLYGIWHVDHNTNLLYEADTVIRAIGKLISDDTKRKTVTSLEVANLTGLDLSKVEFLIKEIRLLGYFWSDVVSATDAGYSEVSVGEEKVFNKYYQYEGIEKLFADLNAKNEPLNNAAVISNDKQDVFFEKEDLPMFPDILPSRITKSIFHVIEVDDILTEDDLQELIEHLYNHPEHHFYYYQEKDGRSNELLHRARDRHEIFMNEVEFFYYKHPNFDGDYIKIERHDGKYEWDWEKEVVEKQPMFMQIRLQLTERKKRELEIKQKIESERESDNNPLELKPNFMGLGIDIFKAGRWLKKLVKRK